MAPSGNDDIGHVGVIRDLWPDVYAAAHAFVEPMDAIAARLTGHVTATQNTMFPMLSVDNRTWGATDYSDELLGTLAARRQQAADSWCRWARRAADHRQRLPNTWVSLPTPWSPTRRSIR